MKPQKHQKVERNELIRFLRQNYKPTYRLLGKIFRKENGKPLSRQRIHIICQRDNNG